MTAYETGRTIADQSTGRVATLEATLRTYKTDNAKRQLCDGYDAGVREIEAAHAKK